MTTQFDTLSDPIAAERKSIFHDARRAEFTQYHVSLALRDKLIGGIPRDPKLIEGWLRKKLAIPGDQEDELRRALLRTLAELGHDITDISALADIGPAVEQLAGEKNTVGFYRDEQGLYLERRNIEAMLKESINVVMPWPKERLGGKSAKGFLVERVFVEPNHVSLGRLEPDGVLRWIGHPSGPQGKQATLTYYEYVERAEIGFDLFVLGDLIPASLWPKLWVHCEMNGLGALRSQSFGRFVVTQFDRVD